MNLISRDFDMVKFIEIEISFKLPLERSISFAQEITHLGSRTKASVNEWVISNDDKLLNRYDENIYI